MTLDELRILLKKYGFQIVLEEGGSYESVSKYYYHGIYAWNKDYSLLMADYNLSVDRNFRFTGGIFWCGVGGKNQSYVSYRDFEEYFKRAVKENSLPILWNGRSTQTLLINHKEANTIPSNESSFAIFDAITYHKIKKHFPLEVQRQMGVA